MEMVDWSELQYDLIGEVAKNIGNVEDFLSFSKVCPSWHVAAVKENVVVGPQLPWLAMAEKHEEGRKENCRVFFNFKRNERYEIEFPQLGPSRSWGSSLGWIVTVTLDLKIHMINPLSRLKLRLPHLFTFKHLPKDPDYDKPDYSNHEWFMCNFVRKAFIFIRNQQIFAAAMYGEAPYFAIARPGDKSWTEVEGRKFLGIEDAVYFNGQLIALNHDGSLELCEFDWIQAPKFVTIVPRHSHLKYSRKCYLVKSIGNLLMVVRWRDDYDFGEHDAGFIYETVGFDIYELDFQKKKWMELKNLGDMALFLGDSYSLSLSSTDIGCEPNVIYYTDDNYEGWDVADKLYGGHDVGIFRLKDKTCCPLDHNLASDDLRSTVSCPFWIIPSLF